MGLFPLFSDKSLIVTVNVLMKVKIKFYMQNARVAFQSTFIDRQTWWGEAGTEVRIDVEKE